MPGLSHPARNVPGDPVVSELRMFVRIIWSAGGIGREMTWNLQGAEPPLSRPELYEASCSQGKL